MQKIIQDKYHIMGSLGTGGTSCIYRAYDDRVGRQVALKIITGEAGNWKRDAAQRELKILNMLDCAGIPRVLDYCECGGESVIVMDYIQGENLEKYVDRVGPLEEHRTMEIATQLIHILEYLHTEGILFLDLKPANVMLMDLGRVKLVDFGSAVLKHEITEGFAHSGTYGYAAPELLRRDMVDERADIYSLGVTLYFAMTGISPAKPPYEIGFIGDWNAALSVKTQDMMANCLQKDIGLRYGNMAQLQEALLEKDKLYKKSLKWKAKRYFRKKKRVLLKQEKNIFCTEKRAVGLLCGFFLVAIAAGNFSVQSQAAKNQLFVHVKNEIGQKLLIREGAIYYTKESIIFEIPEKELEAEAEYEILIKSRNLFSGQEKEKIFHIVRQEKELKEKIGN